MRTFMLVAFCSALLFAALDSCTAQNNTLSHHLMIGARPFADKLFRKEVVQVNSKFYTVLEERRTFSTDGRAVITLVKALDQKTNGNGAVATLIGGGPGQTYVTLEFKSQRGHGIHFVVEIYARYP